MKHISFVLLLLFLAGNCFALEVGYNRTFSTGTPNCSSPIGISTIGTSSGNYAGSDAPYITNSGASCVANQICMYTTADGATTTHIKLALYAATSSTQPGELLAETSEITIPGGTGLGWQCGSISPVTLNGSTSYFLSWLSDRSITYRYDASSVPVVYKTMTYANGHDDPYGTPEGNLTRSISMYIGHD